MQRMEVSLLDTFQDSICQVDERESWVLEQLPYTIDQLIISTQMSKDNTQHIAIGRVGCMICCLDVKPHPDPIWYFVSL